MRRATAVIFLVSFLAGCISPRESEIEVPVLLVPDGAPAYQPRMTEAEAAEVLSLAPPVEVVRCESPYDDGGSISGLLEDSAGKTFAFARGPIIFDNTRLYEAAGYYRSGILLPQGSAKEQALVSLLHYWLHRQFSTAQLEALRPPEDSGESSSNEPSDQIWKGITCRRLIYAYGERSANPDPFEDRLHRLGVAVSEVGEITNGLYRVTTHPSFASLDLLHALPIAELAISSSNIVDLTALKGMPLRRLWIRGCGVSRLEPLQGMLIQMLDLSETSVSDLTPLGAMPLELLFLRGTQVRDLSPLAGMSTLQRLDICDAPVEDLSPLKGLGLDSIEFCPTNITKGIDSLRQMKTLMRITPYPSGSGNRPAHFWQRYDAGEFRQNKPKE